MKKSPWLILATLMLRDQPVKVMDVGLEFLFDFHEWRTRAFPIVSQNRSW
jgi:hypothetical protein